MACGGCKRRSKLIQRTFSRVIRRVQPISSSPDVTVNKTCTGAVKLTPKGYVMTCDTCSHEGNPSKFPESATIDNCPKGK